MYCCSDILGLKIVNVSEDIYEVHPEPSEIVVKVSIEITAYSLVEHV